MQKTKRKEKFQNWANQVDSIQSQDTIDTYWKQIKKIPEFSLKKLKKEDIDKARKTRNEIIGRIDRNITSRHQLQAVRRYIDSKLYYIRKDKTITDREYTRIKISTKEILESITFDEAENSRKNQKINEHYIHKDDLIKLLRKADPIRAKYWASTYLLGVRWKASKRLTDDLFFRDRGEHGMVRIPEKRTKSKFTRDIYLLDDSFWHVIDSSPMGDWVDRHGRKWTDVYFPDRNQDKENYQLGKKHNGKIYGLIGEIGLSPRTMHSFRHTRITDLLKAEDMNLSNVQDRSGHSKTDSTNHYKQVSFDRDPKSLEQYVDENNLDLMEVLNY